MIVCCAVQPFPLDEAEQDLVLAGQGLVEARARHQCIATEDRDKLHLPWLRENPACKSPQDQFQGSRELPKLPVPPAALQLPIANLCQSGHQRAD